MRYVTYRLSLSDLKHERTDRAKTSFTSLNTITDDLKSAEKRLPQVCLDRAHPQVSINFGENQTFFVGQCPTLMYAKLMFAEITPLYASFLSTSAASSGDLTHTSTQESSSVVSESLQKAVIQLIRPLVKAMIEGGITYPVLADLLRRTYVEIAQSKQTAKGKPPSNSRIFVVTGVNRKEIKRLRSETAQEQAPPEKISLSAKVIAVWCSKPEYLDKNGHPIALPRVAPDGQPSLEQLVTSVSMDVRSGALIAEWLRSGVVERQDNKVRLVTTALIPGKGFEEKAYYFGRNLREHIAAGTHNLFEMGPAFFDRTVYYDRVSPESVEELRRLCANRGEELLLEINRKARELAERDRASSQPRGRMTFGAYFFGKDDVEDQ